MLARNKLLFPLNLLNKQRLLAIFRTMLYLSLLPAFYGKRPPSNFHRWVSDVEIETFLVKTRKLCLLCQRQLLCSNVAEIKKNSNNKKITNTYKWVLSEVKIHQQITRCCVGYLLNILSLSLL